MWYGFTAGPYLEQQAAQVSPLSGCPGSEGKLETIRSKMTGSTERRHTNRGVDNNRPKADTFASPRWLDGANAHFTGEQGSPEWSARRPLRAPRTQTPAQWCQMSWRRTRLAPDVTSPPPEQPEHFHTCSIVCSHDNCAAASLSSRLHQWVNLGESRFCEAGVYSDDVSRVCHTLFECSTFQQRRRGW